MQHDLRRWMRLVEGTIPTQIRPPSEDVYEVLDANYEFGRMIGNKVLPIDQLHGGVNLRDPKERLRVDRLKSQMNGPNGYISRLIVNTDGDVIEGQHRLTALTELGAHDVPVVVIQDMAAHVDMARLETAIDQTQSMHPDQRHYLIREIFSLIAKEGSAAKVRDEYYGPQGFDKAFEAALLVLEQMGL